jgi:hypothetical protein
MADSRGPSIDAKNAPAVPAEGMNTEQGGNRGNDVVMSVPAVPRTRTQAQVPGGATIVANSGHGQDRTMPKVSVIR